MARGKQARASLNRANEAAREHIDRLTDQLAEAKARARAAEERARESDLLRERVAELQRRIDEDEMLAKFLKTWDPLANDLQTIHELFRLVKDAFYLAVKDVMLCAAETAFTGSTVLGYADIAEFVMKRYPEFGRALKSSRHESYVAHDDRTLLRLSDEQVRRLQRVRGDRGAFPFKPDSTVADVLVDIVEAIEADLRGDDLEEYIGVWDSDWTELAAKREMRRGGATKWQVQDLTSDDLTTLRERYESRREESAS